MLCDFKSDLPRSNNNNSNKLSICLLQCFVKQLNHKKNTDLSSVSVEYQHPSHLLVLLCVLFPFWFCVSYISSTAKQARCQKSTQIKKKKTSKVLFDRSLRFLLFRFHIYFAGILSLLIIFCRKFLSFFLGYIIAVDIFTYLGIYMCSVSEGEGERGYRQRWGSGWQQGWILLHTCFFFSRYYPSSLSIYLTSISIKFIGVLIIPFVLFGVRLDLIKNFLFWRNAHEIWYNPCSRRHVVTGLQSLN